MCIRDRYDSVNDGYYVHKKFKDKKKALNYIKDRKDKIWKKYKDTFTKEIKNKKFWFICLTFYKSSVEYLKYV